MVDRFVQVGQVLKADRLAEEADVLRLRQRLVVHEGDPVEAWHQLVVACARCIAMDSLGGLDAARGRRIQAADQSRSTRLDPCLRYHQLVPAACCAADPDLYDVSQVRASLRSAADPPAELAVDLS